LSPPQTNFLLHGDHRADLGARGPGAPECLYQDVHAEAVVEIRSANRTVGNNGFAQQGHGIANRNVRLDFVGGQHQVHKQILEIERLLSLVLV
jgi:hypothetical protein